MAPQDFDRVVGELRDEHLRTPAYQSSLVNPVDSLLAGVAMGIGCNLAYDVIKALIIRESKDKRETERQFDEVIKEPLYEDLRKKHNSDAPRDVRTEDVQILLPEREWGTKVDTGGEPPAEEPPAEEPPAEEPPAEEPPAEEPPAEEPPAERPD